MNPEQHARQLLDRLGVRHPCDLDLLVFFARHPRTLLASEHLSAFMGYALKQIAESLEVLLAAGFLTRTPNAYHAARMYVFSVGGPHDELVGSLVQFMSTREGRLTMRRAQARRSAEGPNGAAGHVKADASTEPGQRPVFVRRTETIDGAQPWTRRRGGR